MHCGKVLKYISLVALISTPALTFADAPSNQFNKTNFHITALYLQPNSNNLKYAVFVSGNQPLSQSWHNQEIDPSYSPAFELGFNYAYPQTMYNASIDWLHVNTNDSDFKQAATGVNPATVEFVAPPYDVGPAVFGIKRGYSTVNFNFNTVKLNLGRIFEFGPHMMARVFGGLDILRINQTLKTTFSDMAGAVPIPTQAYGLLPDPSFYFRTTNTSKYTGIGPDLGMDAQYQASNGFGVLGEFLGTISAGRMSTKDSFASASSQLLAQGIAVSHQAITAPDSTQVVPGFDSKLGIFYSHSWQNSYTFSIEAGYRFAYYLNAISSVIPGTLVQPLSNSAIPEFSTGTMAINSTDSRTSPFSLNGPYLNFTLAIA